MATRIMGVCFLEIKKDVLLNPQPHTSGSYLNYLGTPEIIKPNPQNQMLSHIRLLPSSLRSWMKQIVCWTWVLNLRSNGFLQHVPKSRHTMFFTATWPKEVPSGGWVLEGFLVGEGKVALGDYLKRVLGNRP